MEIIEAKYEISSPNFELCPATNLPEYAFIGRSNVGKSSLINMLCNNEKLAKTSNSPGKTQLINHFIISSRKEKGADLIQWYLVDLPGYGFAKRSISMRNKWEQMTENYLRKRENLEHLFVLIDSRHSPQKIDLEFCAKLYKWQTPYSLVFTKTDKENQRTVSKNIKDFKERLLAAQQFLPQMLLSSVVKKSGRQKILDVISSMNDDYFAA